MAGGSQIVISDDGITISTGGKILYQAGQHKFESGQKVVSPVTVLPTTPDSYSLKFKYKSNLPEQKDGIDKNLSLNKELFIISNSDNSLIQKTVLNQMDLNGEYSVGSRFYTEKTEDVCGMLFMSNEPFLFFEQNLELEDDENKKYSMSEEDIIIAEADKE